MLKYDQNTGSDGFQSEITFSQTEVPLSTPTKILVLSFSQPCFMFTLSMMPSTVTRHWMIWGEQLTLNSVPTQSWGH
ncbi:hypothetical protein KIN20_034746 [Parelaphostrongylus tenuis]|uniref:Uncharacterized protein n=1 Tax=Parelaphostrongylus tenuis TaxID=148309 RepID=A0AAD5WJF3_PARTN|nr:hypothetical protein KIN20_034746 [Parelaphostrongylus tenuis]